MSLPPDPHEDDLSDPAASVATPAPPPPPPPPPPPSPSGDGPGPSGVTPPPAASDAYAGPAHVAAPRPPAPAPEPGEPPAAPVLGARPSRGRHRARLAVGAVVALVVVVGGALVIAGGGDDETSAPASDEAPSDESDESDSPAASDTDDAGSGDGGSGDGGESEPAAPADATATPEATAEALFAAARVGDCETLIGLLAPEAFDTVDPAAAIAECEADADGRASMAELEIVDISLVSETGDEAVVAVTAMVDGETSTEELPLRRIDGAWMVVSLE